MTASLQFYGRKAAPVPVRWAAPEMLLKARMSEKSDVWAFGVTAWEVCTREPIHLLTARHAVLGADARTPFRSGFRASLFACMHTVRTWL